MKTILKDILVPIDFSDTSLNALRCAVDIARRHHATLHLFYVNDVIAYYPRIGELGTASSMADEILEKDIYLLEKLAQSITAGHHVDCRFHIATGNRELIIREWVKERSIDLTVIGMTPDIDQATYLFDTLAFKILQDAACDVLTIPACKSGGSFARILYPVQSHGAPMARYNLVKAIAEKSNAEVSLLSLVEKADMEMSGILNSFAERIKSRLIDKVKRVRNRHIFTKNAAVTLTEVSREQAADLIVIEADTRRTVKEFFTGNFTQRMLRNPSTAVWCVKAV